MIGLLRVKNEARWIERSLRSILPVCERVIVFDDHSTDGTREICRAIENVQVVESPFTGLNETRDKNVLLDMARHAADWVLMIDGDEVLADAEQFQLQFRLAETQRMAQSYSFPVLYLWDSEEQYRTDGVYGRFRRPSMFRPGNHRFTSTTAGGNFHCGNVPLAIQAQSVALDVPLLHFGYLHREDRVRKYAWYNTQDPKNANEDGYRHMVIGDVFPAESKFRYGGPLKLEALCSRPIL